MKLTYHKIHITKVSYMKFHLPSDIQMNGWRGGYDETIVEVFFNLKHTAFLMKTTEVRFLRHII